jgi:hypothetical protein
MKRFLLVVAAVAFFASSEAEAGRYYSRSSYRPMRTYSYRSNYSYNRSPGLFSQMMEFERAKNAWLRSTFLGY